MDIEHRMISAFLCLESPKKLWVEHVRFLRCQIHGLIFWGKVEDKPRKWWVQLAEPFVPKDVGFYVGFLTPDEENVQICKVEGVSKRQPKEKCYPYGSIAVVKMFPVMLLPVKEVTLDERWD